MATTTDARACLRDGIAWGGNISTAVGIIFVNKVLMRASGYGFHFGAHVHGRHSVTALQIDLHVEFAESHVASLWSPSVRVSAPSARRLRASCMLRKPRLLSHTI